MKRRIITDRIDLLNKQARSLIRTFTDEFGNPKIVRLKRTETHIPYFRSTLTWNLSDKKMKFTGNPPHITITIFNNSIYNPNKKNPASLGLLKKKSKVLYFGYNGKNYETYYQIMNEL